jgi:fatty aldehyde-generating acyl-ACP reductase
VRAISDIFIIIQSLWYSKFRKRRRKGECFAFIAHPRVLKDAYNAFPFLEKLPPRLRTAVLSFIWPLLTSVMTTDLKTADGSKLTGYFINISLTPEMIFKNVKAARRKIRRAVILARNLGANSVGLGALLPPVVSGGGSLEKELGVKVSSGYAFSVQLMIMNLEALSTLLNFDIANSTVAIVGASQKIGDHVTRIIAPDTGKLLLFDQSNNEKRVSELFNDIKKANKDVNIEQLSDKKGLKNADIILVFTSARGAVLDSDCLKEGCIIIDDTQPNAVPRSIVKERPDVLVVDGGITRLPGFNPHFRLGLLQKEDMWGCLGETIMLSWMMSNGMDISSFDFENNREEAMHILKTIPSQMGFTAAKPRSFSNRAISKEDVEKYRIKSDSETAIEVSVG